MSRRAKHDPNRKTPWSLVIGTFGLGIIGMLVAPMTTAIVGTSIWLLAAVGYIFGWIPSGKGGDDVES